MNTHCINTEPPLVADQACVQLESAKTEDEKTRQCPRQHLQGTEVPTVDLDKNSSVTRLVCAVPALGQYL